MSKLYAVNRKVWGIHGTDVYEFDVGEVKPKDAAEALILEHLVEIGRAKVVIAVDKSKKKEA